MAIFNSYVSLPKGKSLKLPMFPPSRRSVPSAVAAAKERLSAMGGSERQRREGLGKPWETYGKLTLW